MKEVALARLNATFNMYNYTFNGCLVDFIRLSIWSKFINVKFYVFVLFFNFLTIAEKKYIISCGSV